MPTWGISFFPNIFVSFFSVFLFQSRLLLLCHPLWIPRREWRHCFRVPYSIRNQKRMGSSSTNLEVPAIAPLPKVWDAESGTYAAEWNHLDRRNWAAAPLRLSNGTARIEQSHHSGWIWTIGAGQGIMNMPVLGSYRLQRSIPLAPAPAALPCLCSTPVVDADSSVPEVFLWYFRSRTCTDRPDHLGKVHPVRFEPGPVHRISLSCLSTACTERCMGSFR